MVGNIITLQQGSNLVANIDIQQIANIDSGQAATLVAGATCGELLAPSGVATLPPCNPHPPPHPPGRPYTCPKCLKTFKSTTHLRSHEKSHSEDRPHSCTQCDAAFKFKGALKRHAVTQHTEGKGRRHKCSHCGKAFFELGHLKEHVLTHTEERRYWCATCRVGFRHRHKYNVHMLSHRLKEGQLSDIDVDMILRCEICDKDFTRKDHYKNHLRIHSGDDDIPFRCDVCSKGFRWKASLNAHTRRHNCRDDGPQKMTCDVCQRRFANKAQMKRHQREHVAQREYKCTTCSESFSQRAALACHKRIEHSQKRLHLCEGCGLTFLTSQYLATHRRRCLNDSSGNYVCFQCNKKCRTQKAFLNHRKTHIDSSGVDDNSSTWGQSNKTCLDPEKQTQIHSSSSKIDIEYDDSENISLGRKQTENIDTSLELPAGKDGLEMLSCTSQSMDCDGNLGENMAMSTRSRGRQRQQGGSGTTQDANPEKT